MWFLRKAPATGKTEPRPLLAVRMEAIGGQGAHSAGKILAEAAVLGQGFTGNHFSSFGSEKRGSPVRSFVRFSPARSNIRSAAFIAKPDLLVIFHESLLLSHPEIVEGAGPGTDLVINTTEPPSRVRFPRSTAFRNLIALDASAIALRQSCGLNAVLLGAASHFLPELDAKALEETLSRFFTKAPPKMQQANLAGFRAGRSEISQCTFDRRQSSEEAGHSSLPRMGYLNAPPGGLICEPGNTVLKDNSASRKGFAPRLFRDTCFHCGYCDMVCPDFCFVWKTDPAGKAELLGIDYQYCKGCQKCVAACPVEALQAVPESEIPAEERVHRLFPQAARSEPRKETEDK